MNEEYFSSTGSLGVSRRPDNRLYINTVRFNDDAAEVARNFDRAINFSERFPGQIGRVVCRGIFSEPAVGELSAGQYRGDMEAGLPLDEFGFSSFLLYLSRNAPTRRALLGAEEMIVATNETSYHSTEPETNIARAARRGFDLTEAISADGIRQVYQLWHETFGWSEQDVANFASRLSAEKSVSPQLRSVWFCGAREPESGRVVSCAMAERIQLPAEHGRRLNLVESTEWSTEPGFRGQGLMSAVLTRLHASVLCDLERYTDGRPLIYAECNFSTRSDVAGHNGGLRIPPRQLLIGGRTVDIPQILVQNVSVYDQQNRCSGGLKDFSFMYLPPQIADQLIGLGGQL